MSSISDLIKIILLAIGVISLMGTVSALVVMLVKKVLGGRISPFVHVCLWFLLIIRLVMPITAESRFSVFNLAYLFSAQGSQAEASEEPAAPAAEVVQTDNLAAENTSIQPLETEAVPESAPENTSIIDDSTMKETFKLDVFTVLLAIYLAVAFGVLLTYTVNYFTQKKRISENLSTPSEKDVAVFNEIRRELNIKRKIRFYRGGDSMFMGIFNPILILASDCEDIQAVITHELMHYKNKDNVISVIIALVKCLHWFNPVVHLAMYKFKNDLEVLCDIRSIQKLNYRKDDYAMMLFKSSDKKNKEKAPPVAATCMSASGKQLIYRIKSIAKFRNSSKKAKIIAAALIFVMVVTTLTNPIGALSTITNRNGWAENYLSNLAFNDINYFEDKNLDEKITAGEYITLVNESFAKIGMPVEISQNLKAVNTVEAMLAEINKGLDEKITADTNLNREQIAYITDKIIVLAGLDKSDAEEEPVIFPNVIPKDIFESEIASKFEEGTRDYQKLMAYFQLKDVSKSTLTPEDKEELLLAYPFLAKTPVYIFDPLASEREITEMFERVNKFAPDFLADKTKLINMRVELGIIQTSNSWGDDLSIMLDSTHQRYSHTIKHEDIREIFQNSYETTNLADSRIPEEVYNNIMWNNNDFVPSTPYFTLRGDLTAEQKNEIKEVWSKYGASYEKNTSDKNEKFDSEYNIPTSIELTNMFKVFSDVKYSMVETEQTKAFSRISQYYHNIEIPEDGFVFDASTISVRILKSDVSEETMRQFKLAITQGMGGVTDAALIKINEATEYKDNAKISDYAKVSVDNMAQFGIMNGSTNGKFAPNDYVTNAQVAKILTTLLCSIVMY